MDSTFPIDELTPRQIVQELDKYIIAQGDAKKAVAIALRNRWRRLQVHEDLRDEITPKNILMIGPTGVGKTEISRRLAKLAHAPFVKVEASKFTEVGYVGRDVESIVRDLVEVAIEMTREDAVSRVQESADRMTEDRLLELLSTRVSGATSATAPQVSDESVAFPDPEGVGDGETVDRTALGMPVDAEELRERLQRGDLDDDLVEIEVTRQVHTQMQIVGPQGFGEIEGQIKDIFSQMIPKQREVRQLPVREARKYLSDQFQDELINQDEIVQIGLRRAEETGIVFIDEIDKICGPESSGRGPDVSREGVQRDLLPLVEGSTVSTKYGVISTDHILFIASGAFHHSKPSDLMPEFQGRFPIRVELTSLTSEHFYQILTEPKNALTRQYKALLATEGVDLEFSEEALRAVARLTAEVNESTENIGARRLHTVLERVLEDLSFTASERRGDLVEISAEDVHASLSSLVKNQELSRYIL